MSQLPIRIIFGKEIIRLAEEYDYYAVCADTKCCSFENFGDIYPERQISIGIAEQNLIGVAGGFAADIRLCWQRTAYLQRCVPVNSSERIFVIPNRMLWSWGLMQGCRLARKASAIQPLRTLRFFVPCRI